MSVRLSCWAVALAALAFIALYVSLAIVRLAYPYELEWMEGASFDHVMRILAGQKLYVPPTLDFVPFIYTPLYFYVAAGFTWMLGPGLWPLRLVSLLASGGCLLLIGQMVWKQTHSRLAGLLAAGLFAATYSLSGTWLDLARVDSLFLFLLLLAAAFLRRQGSSLAWMLSALIWAAAFLTKQTALLIALPMMLYCVLVDWRRCWAFIVPFVALVGGGSLLLDWLHGGWFSYYAFSLPARHGLVGGMLQDFWTVDMAAFVLAFVAGLCALGEFWTKDRKAFWFFALLSAGMLAASYSARLHEGGYVNSLIPACAALAILFALGYQSLRQLIAQGFPQRDAGMRTCLNVAFLLQLLVLTYHPASKVPTWSDRQAAEETIAALRNMPGEIYLPPRGYLLHLAGKKTFAHQMAVQDVLRADPGPIADQLAREIAQALRDHRFSCVIVGDDSFDDMGLTKYYRRIIRPFDNPDVLFPVTGYHVRPETMYFPE